MRFINPRFTYLLTYLRSELYTPDVLKPTYFMTQFRAAAVWLEPENGSEAWSVTSKKNSVFTRVRW